MLGFKNGAERAGLCFRCSSRRLLAVPNRRSGERSRTPSQPSRHLDAAFRSPNSGCPFEPPLPDHRFRPASSMPHRLEVRIRSAPDSPPRGVAPLRGGSLPVARLPYHYRRSRRILASCSRPGSFNPRRSALATIRRLEACPGGTTCTRCSPPALVFYDCHQRINVSGTFIVPPGSLFRGPLGTSLIVHQIVFRVN
jgi:hypothetical protein